jgi:hypothetical protein
MDARNRSKPVVCCNAFVPRKLFAVIEYYGGAFVLMGTQQTRYHSRYTLGMFAAYATKI